MGKFVAVETISLDSLGEGWEKCYIKLNALTVGDLEKLAGLREDKAGDVKAAKEIMDVLESKFIEGKGWNGKEVVAIEKSDLRDLPAKAIGKIVTTFTEVILEKK